MHMISIVIPVFNEAENINLLLDEIKSNLISHDYEIIYINDSSTDNTLEILNSHKTKNNILILNNKSNKGQSYSIHKGVLNSKYDIIVTIDGDCQNNPADISKLLETYLSNDEVKLVGGIRKKRKDSYVKIITSKIANYFRSMILNDHCPDTGCSLKVFDKKIFLTFPFFTGMHRFLPALFIREGCKIDFVNVSHAKRMYGYSKYSNLKRFIDGIFDLIGVLWLIKRSKKADIKNED